MRPNKKRIAFLRRGLLMYLVMTEIVGGPRPGELTSGNGLDVPWLLSVGALQPALVPVIPQSTEDPFRDDSGEGEPRRRGRRVKVA
jgi:hypothetical protein